MLIVRCGAQVQVARGWAKGSGGFDLHAVAKKLEEDGYMLESEL